MLIVQCACWLSIHVQELIKRKANILAVTGDSRTCALCAAIGEILCPDLSRCKD